MSDNEGVAMPAHGDNGTVSSPFMIIQKTWIPAIPPQQPTSCMPGTPVAGMTGISGLKAASYWDENSGAMCVGALSSHGGAALNFGKWKDILHMCTGREPRKQLNHLTPGFDTPLCFNFNREHTLQLRGGSGVAAPRPLYLNGDVGDYKEM